MNIILGLCYLPDILLALSGYRMLKPLIDKY